MSACHSNVVVRVQVFQPTYSFLVSGCNSSSSKSDFSAISQIGPLRVLLRGLSFEVTSQHRLSGLILHLERASAGAGWFLIGRYTPAAGIRRWRSNIFFCGPHMQVHRYVLEVQCFKTPSGHTPQATTSPQNPVHFEPNTRDARSASRITRP